MKLIDVDGVPLDVRFQHGLVATCWNLAQLINVDYTGCTIWAGDTVVGMGAAYRNPDDRPNRMVGRKIAFGRALKDADIPRETRTKLWHQFFEQSPRHKQ